MLLLVIYAQEDTTNTIKGWQLYCCKRRDVNECHTYIDLRRKKEEFPGGSGPREEREQQKEKKKKQMWVNNRETFAEVSQSRSAAQRVSSHHQRRQQCGSEVFISCSLRNQQSPADGWLLYYLPHNVNSTNTSDSPARGLSFLPTKANNIRRVECSINITDGLRFYCHGISNPAQF